MHLKVLIHHEGSQFWSEIPELPGCFASGRTLTELREALAEAVGLYLWDLPADIEAVELAAGTAEIDVRPRALP